MQERSLARLPKSEAMNAALHGSIYRSLPDVRQSECFEELCRSKSFRVERIISGGQGSPPGFWYDQAWDEWVVVLEGWAVVQLQEPEEVVRLSTGDWLMINAHRKHRVLATSQKPATIWLAVHGTV
jgi:cupin 2 domain-containing protein